MYVCVNEFLKHDVGRTSDAILMKLGQRVDFIEEWIPIVFGINQLHGGGGEAGIHKNLRTAFRERLDYRFRRNSTGRSNILKIEFPKFPSQPVHSEGVGGTKPRKVRIFRKIHWIAMSFISPRTILRNFGLLLGYNLAAISMLWRNENSIIFQVSWLHEGRTKSCRIFRIEKKIDH